jgi:hypothetical protein
MAEGKQAYTLDEVAAQWLPKHWTDSKRWLQRRLNRGEITGYKVGHDWMMTDADVEKMINRYRNSGVAAVKETPVESVSSPAVTSVVAGLSARSRRRLRPTG